MSILKPENTSRKLDSLGRLTLPKSLRDRMGLEEYEIFTADIEGRDCIVLASPVDKEKKIRGAIELLKSCGVDVDGLNLVAETSE